MRSLTIGTTFAAPGLTPSSTGLGQGAEIDGWLLIVRCLTYADKVCLRRASGRETRQGSARRCKGEVTMLLIPVVLVIGGILALVLYLEKRSPPYRQ
jgi:hypothetical protein